VVVRLVQEMEIFPNQGIGEICFGVNPLQLTEIMGDQFADAYEEWQDGNLNDGICYTGFLFVFNKMDGGIPANDSQLIEIWANGKAQLTIQGKNLFQQSRVQIKEFLRAGGIEYSVRDNGNEFYIEECNWEIAFSPERDAVSKIWMYGDTSKFVKA